MLITSNTVPSPVRIATRLARRPLSGYISSTMKLRCAILALVLPAIAAAGCNKSEPSPAANSSAVHSSPSDIGGSGAAPTPTAGQTDSDAIKAAIENHLRRNAGINMAAMDTTIDSVSITDDHAQANVTFRLKQGGTSMQMTYFLEHHADGWNVVRNQPAGGQFAHPPLDKTHSGAAAAPGDHPLPDINKFFSEPPPPKANPDSQPPAPREEPRE